MRRRINTWFDRKSGEQSRRLARQTSRRSFLGRLGTGIVGMNVLPLLPVLRAFGADDVDELGDPKSCDYWRYCAVSGNLCACCGGSLTSCPPGSEPSPITWVGTCHNPANDRDYLISYNDCCGKSSCQRCGCHNTERDRPVYFPPNSGSILWCFGTEARSYHCTVAVVLGEATGGD